MVAAACCARTTPGESTHRTTTKKTTEPAIEPAPPRDLSSVGELKDDDDTAFGTRVDDLLADLSEERGRPLDAAGNDGEVLLAVLHVGDGALENSGPDVELPQDLSALRVDGLQITALIAVEHE